MYSLLSIILHLFICMCHINIHQFILVSYFEMLIMIFIFVCMLLVQSVMFAGKPSLSPQ